MKKLFVLILLFPFLATLAGPLPKPLAELVAAERKFSETCGQKGIRDSFLKFFADDAVTFDSEVRRGKAGLRELPAVSPNSPKLQWEPVYGDISAAGDLGYTTGPYVRTAKTGQTGHGIFFSIWKRQSSGNLQVVLDAGSPTPKPEGEMGREFQPAPRVQYDKGIRIDPKPGREELASAERRFAEIAQKEGLGRALLLSGDTSLRLHRARALPFMGAQQADELLKEHSVLYHCEPLGSDLSSSGDLGYVYGSYRTQGDPGDRGFYVRVWRRNGQGQWRVVLDSMHPLPKN